MSQTLKSTVFAVNILTTRQIHLSNFCALQRKHTDRRQAQLLPAAKRERSRNYLLRRRRTQTERLQD